MLLVSRHGIRILRLRVYMMETKIMASGLDQGAIPFRQFWFALCLNGVDDCGDENGHRNSFPVSFS